MKKITRSELRKIINESLTSGFAGGSHLNHPYKQIYNRLQAEASARGAALGSMLKPENIAEIREHITNTSRKSQGSYYNNLPAGALGLNELTSDVVGSNNTLPDLFPVLSKDHDEAVNYFREYMSDTRNTSIVSWLDSQVAMIQVTYYKALIQKAMDNGLQFVPSNSRGSDAPMEQEAHRLMFGYLIAP